jgi:superfamily II DNA or RNA helicase
MDSINPESAAILFIDEAHHAAKRNGMYEKVLYRFGALKGQPGRKDLLLLGLTATPNRSDNVGLELIFDEIVYQKSIQEMISEGWLTEISAWRVWTQSDISQVGTSMGDFKSGELSKAVNSPSRNKVVVDKYLEIGQGLPAVAFTVDVQHSEDLAQAFVARGIEAKAISGSTPEKECRAILADFRERRFPVLTSCMKISEGFDAPVATVALMARPTKSQLLYIQQIGRVLRPYPAPEDRDNHNGWRKEQAIIVDFSDNTGRHSVLSIPKLFGLPASLNPKGERASKLVKRHESLVAKFPALAGRDCHDLGELEAVAERISLFERPKQSKVAGRYSKFVWTETENVHRLAMPDGVSIMIIENQLGQFEVWKSYSGFRTYLSSFRDMRSAFEFGDSLVPYAHANLLMSSAKWRSERPTEKQISALYSLDRHLRSQFKNLSEACDFIYRMYDSGNEDFTRGAISERITEAILKKTSARART